MKLRTRQKTAKLMPIKIRKIQAASPPIDSILTNLCNEITLLNYKNYPIRTNDPFQRRCTQFFRSHSDKRLIGAFVTLRTFMKRWSTQKQILERFPSLKKAFVSLVFKHCVEEGWFISKPTDLNPNIQCYQVCEMMIKSAKEYYTFCSSSRNELEFIF
tara:strand:- start:3203 stop:3676 length:474 start_codon:yes stop_codon:yes gene_type:complete